MTARVEPRHPPQKYLLCALRAKGREAHKTF
jgi:hypothetical protein